MSTEDEVREASKQFYAALSRMAKGDASSMAGVWSHGSTVTAMHPIGGREVGWDAVRDSFDQVAQVAVGGEVGMKDQLVQVVGDVALEVGIEHGQLELAGQPVTIEHRVTNLYRREAGAWKLVHHHADTSSAMLDILPKSG